MKINDLVAFERLMLSKLNYALYPLASPAAFVRCLVGIWPGGDNRPDLINTANDMIGVFMEGV